MKDAHLVYHVGVLAFLAFPCLLLLWNARGRLNRSPWPAAVIATLYGTSQIRAALANVRAPQAWDYGCFWLYAHVARMHGNIYDPSLYTKYRLPFSIDSDFVKSVLEVGFPYPPPTLALFLPFGSIDDVSQGLALWYVAQLVAFAIAVYALQRAFFPRDGLRGAVLVGALLLMLPAFGNNTTDAQTSVMLLALIAIGFIGREHTWGAYVTTLAIWIKPYAFALVLADVAARRYRRLVATAGTVAVSLAASVALVGTESFVTFFQSNPSLREPSSSFTESVNQSLLAMILRGTRAQLGTHLSLFAQPLFLIAATALLILTAYACVRYRKQSDLCFSLALLLGLLIYPGTLAAYGTVVIIPILVLWSNRDCVPLKNTGVALVAGAVVLLQGPLHNGFYANALLWLSTAVTLVIPAASATPNENGPKRISA